MKCFKKLSFIIIILLIGISLSTASPLDRIFNSIGNVDLKTLKEEIKKLPEEEKLKLQVVLLTLGEEYAQAQTIIKKLYNKPIISNVLELPENLYAIVVDKTKEDLYVVEAENGVPKIVDKMPCITGKRPGDKLQEGDMRTPEGIYFPMYWLSKLPKKYGIGAFPLNYPNMVDQKILKRDGHGIWIHGTDNPNRPPHSTNGCIALRNEYLKKLKELVSLKRTPVVVVSQIAYADKSSFLKEKASLINFLFKWKKAWENTPKDLQPYLDCYSKNFVWIKGDFSEWERYKKRVTRYKKWIKIDISDVSIVKDGRLLEFGNLYAIRMNLHYRSNNHVSKVNKLLYVIREDGKWRILAEENL